jgi:hypothetical protein
VAAPECEAPAATETAEADDELALLAEAAPVEWLPKLSPGFYSDTDDDEKFGIVCNITRACYAFNAMV